MVVSFEFTSGLVYRKRPVNLDLGGVSGFFPSLDFGSEGFQIWESLVEALAGKRGELDFGHVQPRSMFWGKMEVNF